MSKELPHQRDLYLPIRIATRKPSIVRTQCLQNSYFAGIRCVIHIRAYHAQHSTWLHACRRSTLVRTDEDCKCARNISSRSPHALCNAGGERPGIESSPLQLHMWQHTPSLHIHKVRPCVCKHRTLCQRPHLVDEVRRSQ